MKALLILLTVAVAFAAKRYDGEQVLRIHPQHEKHLKELAALERMDNIGQRLDFWKGPTTPSHPVDVRVPKDLLKEVKSLLEKTGMKYTVMIDDLQQRINTERSHVRAIGFNFDDYNTYDDINAQLQDFAASYPDLASVFTIGTSHEGRAINVIKVGSADRSGKPAVFLEGMIHAREWVVGATLLYNIKFMLEGYGSDSQITTLMNNVDFYFMPVTNPDGYAHTQNDRMWRKTRSGPHGSSWWGGQCYGVDPNRNWDEHFAGPGTSSDPCSDIYHGPRAFSEVETQAVSDWVLANSQDIKAYLGVHAYSQMWMTPYGWTYNTPPDYEEQYDLAGRVVSAIQSVNRKRFAYGTIANVIYEAAGSSCDWAYTKAGIKYSYAIELRDEGQYGFVLPANQIRPSADEFFAGLLVVAEQVAAEV
ncbi:CPA2 [Branchiostoma lanceolatum]|uniref:CPA2 protein n=1 Tax=Branchiostoma lanceolatum TaxID=7740 RepID=A0A8K0ETM6_BRALA|nr:CPA2 [Branchiostoma lanceolatum]